MQKYLFNNTNFLLTLTSWDKINNDLILTFEIFNHSIDTISISSILMKSNEFESKTIETPRAYQELIFGNSRPDFYHGYSAFTLFKAINRNENRKLALAFKINNASSYNLQIITSDESRFDCNLTNFLHDENYKISNMLPSSLDFAKKIAEALGY
ncbi:MAG: hypothetical protein ACRCW7_08920 [Cetobacterium sp.]